jgi:hypothetical protein
MSYMIILVRRINWVKKIKMGHGEGDEGDGK